MICSCILYGFDPRCLHASSCFLPSYLCHHASVFYHQSSGVCCRLSDPFCRIFFAYDPVLPVLRPGDACMLGILL